MRLDIVRFALFASTTLVVGCAGLAPGAHSSLPSPALVRAATPAPAQVQVPFVTPTGDFHVQASVGGGPVRQVVFDTGSIGMHVIASSAGSSVKRTTTTFTTTYASGTVYSGVIGYGAVKLGSLTTSSKTPIALITKITCIQSKPNCPGKSGVKGAVAAGKYGVMGVRFAGLNGGDAVDSPLGYLPIPYNQGFVVTRDTLYLGLTSRIRASFQTVRLARLSPNNGNGWPAWNNNLLADWAISGARVTGAPIKTLFDTGTSLVLMNVPKGTIPASRVDSKGFLVAGLPLELSISGVLDYQLTSGKTVGVDQMQVAVSSTVSANTGWSPFDHFDLVYDPIHGLMGFRPHLP